MNILAIGCHPDDLEIACSGTLAKYVKNGHSVVMCHVANGDKGHAVIMPDELNAIRTKEAEEAGRVIGAAEVISLNVPDLQVDSKNEDIVQKVVALIRRVQPALIITHSPTDYMRDHLEVSRLVFNASFSSSVPHYCSEIQSYSTIVPIYYMDTLAGVDFMPTEYVDITETIDLKIKALDCHESQIKWMLKHDKIDFLDFNKTVSKFRGLQCGAGFAEGFTRCNVWPRMTAERLLP
jgi:LmbE family N-acetylglucosaminyl deacetylase